MVRIISSTVLFPIAAFGHAGLYFPPSRNVVESHNCPTCANGKSVCGSGTGSQWLADDIQASRVRSNYTTPLTELVAGGMVDLELRFTAAHQGHMVVELCANPEGETIDSDCFVRLDRDPEDTRFSPYIASHPDIFIFPQNSCTQTFLADKPLLARYIVPETAVSEHAILRFHWQSGNSCDSHELTFKNNAPAEALGWSNTIYGEHCEAALTGLWMSCGTDCPNADCAGEQFRNCADVKIVAGDKTKVVVSEAEANQPPPANGEQPGPGKPIKSSSSTTTTTTTRPDGWTAPAPGSGDLSVPVSKEQLDHCIADIRGLSDHNDEFCREACKEYGTANSFGRIWCEATGVPDVLIDCVKEHLKAVCH